MWVVSTARREGGGLECGKDYDDRGVCRCKKGTTKWVIKSQGRVLAFVSSSVEKPGGESRGLSKGVAQCDLF